METDRSLEHLVLTNREIQLIGVEQAWYYRVIPQLVDDELVYYTDVPDNQEQKLEELEMITGIQGKMQVMESSTLTNALNRYYLKEHQADREQIANSPASDDFLTELIVEARRLKSSDIHLESYEERCRVRIRIDGQMIERYTLSRQEYPAIINKIKILSGLDIAEKRLPQDGRINFAMEEMKFDIRVSVLPTLYGEKVVLRLLSNDATNISLNTLGFAEEDLRHYLEGVKRPNGIVLISGPTGSGKTTTLYATLKLLNLDTRNILTIEDPIEYTLEGINQVQLKESIGLTFGSALRTFLRQDPDIIMVGEIRDRDTAEMAIRLALTGHLVLSTIHTNSAWGTVSRLIDMGIPPFLLANTLNTSVAQRLLRMLCPFCKQQEAFNSSLYPQQFRPYYAIDHHFIARGCDKCYHTGYKGRKAVYEIIPIDRELSAHIKNNVYDVREALSERRLKSLAENAFELFASGSTSIEEIYPLLFNF